MLYSMTSKYWYIGIFIEAIVKHFYTIETNSKPNQFRNDNKCC